MTSGLNGSAVWPGAERNAWKHGSRLRQVPSGQFSVGSCVPVPGWFECGGTAYASDESARLLRFRSGWAVSSELEFVIAQGMGIGLIAASIAFGLGLLAGRRWGWVGAIVISGVSLAVCLGAWWAGDPLYPAMLVNVIAVFYLNQRDVRAVFGELSPDDQAADD